MEKLNLPSEPIRLETDGVFDPELDLSGIFSGLPGMLTDTLGKALTDSIKRMTAKPKMEYKVHCFGLSTSNVGPHNVDAAIKGIKQRNQAIEDLLNDGWEIYEPIICPPNVMLILNREKENEEDGEQ
jgi:hypothetical protein